MTMPAWACVRALKFLQKSMMLTPAWPKAGPTGGAGVAAPALICSLIIPVIFFAIGRIPLGTLPGLDLLDLREVELDRGLAAEDGHHDLERVAVQVDVVD